MYQVKFNSNYPLDPERVRADREVFHVPQRSRFISISQIKAYKGSDASNMHDEEPGEDEIEFSDDEAEAADEDEVEDMVDEFQSERDRGVLHILSAGATNH